MFSDVDNRRLSIVPTDWARGFAGGRHVEGPVAGNGSYSVELDIRATDFPGHLNGSSVDLAVFVEMGTVIAFEAGRCGEFSIITAVSVLASIAAVFNI